MDPIPKKHRQRLFIYDVREMLSLFLLGIMTMVFTFTLGLHFGKRINLFPQFAKGKESSLARSLADAIPDKEHLFVDSNGRREIHEVLEDVLTAELHEEVARSGIRLTNPQVVDLPENPKNPNEGATTLMTGANKHSDHMDERFSLRSRGPSDNAKYTLQIGAFPNEEEAKKRLAALVALNDDEYQPVLREVDLKEKGKWYRLYLGQFPTRYAAQKAGEEFHSQNVIDGFVVSPWGDR